jgi:hypothetical protein
MIDAGTHRLALERRCQLSQANLRRSAEKEFDLHSVFRRCDATKVRVALALD